MVCDIDLNLTDIKKLGFNEVRDPPPPHKLQHISKFAIYWYLRLECSNTKWRGHNDIKGPVQFHGEMTPNVRWQAVSAH